MNPTSTAVLPRRRVRAAAPAAVAILYPKVGNVLRIPLRRTRTGGGHGCHQHPERQFMVWFNRMAAARPGFPMQIKSILLITGTPLCRSCYRALTNFLSRYHLAGKLRLRSREPAACGCGGDCRCGASAGPALLDDLLDDLLGETPRRGLTLVRRAPARNLPRTLAAAAAVPASDPSRLLTDRQLLALAPPARAGGPVPATGPYRQVSGHHIHQSGAYARSGASAQNNPNHRIAIAQNVPGFTHAQHDRASAVQRGTNRAAHGHDVDLLTGGVRVRTSGTGTLAPVPQQGFEDIKAYYALLAAGRHPDEALRLVNQSAQQLARARVVPVRVPSR